MRLFVGIPLPDDVRARLAGLGGGLKGARWVAPENLHLSLRFIGEAAGGEDKDIADALKTVSATAFELSLSTLGAFDRRGRVHAIWAGVEKSDALGRLRGGVESTLVRSGLEPEHRKFKPHVTLARMKNGSARETGQFLEAHHGFSAGPFTVDHFTLFESHLGHGGAHYVALSDYPLEG
jgi:2'-5' RNA ligase